MIPDLLAVAEETSDEGILSGLRPLSRKQLADLRRELANRRSIVRATFGHQHSEFIDKASVGYQEYTRLVRLWGLVSAAITRRAFEPTSLVSVRAKTGSPQSDVPLNARVTRKRGPKPDHDTARRVAGVVQKLAPDGEWRPKLYDICDELDASRIKRPRPWKRKGYPDWLTCHDAKRDLVVKAIEHHMELAQREKEETIS